jgi:hypothetical protein
MKPAARRAAARALVPLLAGLVLAGCAGFRGGWASLAYIGDAAPAIDELTQPLHNVAPLNVPGAQLRVTIDNRLRTYDTQVYLYVLPLVVDPRDVYTANHQPGTTRVHVGIVVSEPGFVFRPSLAALDVAGRRFNGIAGFEFGRWDAQGQRVAKGGRWEHRSVGPEMALAETGRRYLLSIDFATPVPSPESRDIALDLSGALRAPQHAPLPLIRFTPVRWKEGYT